MKGFSLIVFFVLVIAMSVSVSAADYNCLQDQQIFRISSQTNAHAELFNGAASYPVHICYDDYFGAFAGTPSRVENATNPAIIKLTGFTNAHAQLPTQSGYSYPVVFSNLSCSTSEATAACPVNTTEIASLSAATNAHVGIPGTYVGAGRYRICCSAGKASGSSCQSGDGQCPAGCTYPSDSDCQPPSGQWTLHWENALGNSIGQSYNKRTTVNQTVQMIANTPFANTNISFEVRDADCIVGNPPCIGDDFIHNFSVISDGSGRARISNFFISDSDFARGLGDEASSELEFYFIARGNNQMNLSEIVLVNRTEDANTPPTATITGPEHRGIYYKNTIVEFKHASSDPEGQPLSVLWTIAEDNYQSTSSTFNYTLTSEGQKTITLRVTDSRGAWDEDQIAIIVVASPGIFAFINEPKHQQVIVNNSLLVKINASDSYVINSVLDGSCPTVTCLSGNCPLKTKNGPGTCGEITIGGTRGNFNSSYFDWSFSDGDTGANMDGFGNALIAKRFGRPSVSYNDKTISLMLNYTNVTLGIFSLTRNTNRVFTLLDADQCIDNGRNWVEYNYTNGAVIATYSTMNTSRCAGADASIGNGDDCCPSGFYCTTQGCRSTGNEPNECSDYRNRTSCTDDAFNAAQDDPLQYPEPLCGQYWNGGITVCSCLWNASAGTSDPEHQGKCLFKESTPSSGCSQPPCSSCNPAQCTQQVADESECSNGYKTVTVAATYTNGTCSGGMTQSECDALSGQRQVLCGRPSIALSFFGGWQFLVTVVLIFIVYIFALRKRK